MESKQDDYISVYARIRPVQGENGSPKISDRTSLTFDCEERSHSYKFANVYDGCTRQEVIFNEVAQPLVDETLRGINSCIFCYGQSGSGKTFTTTGSSTMPGLVPRALEYIFSNINAQPSNFNNIEVHLTYIEIYNGIGYDLLCERPHGIGSRLEDLHRISVQLAADVDVVRLSNASRLQVQSLHTALDIVECGNTNRRVCETPLNDVSTRSHCILTVQLNWMHGHGEDERKRSSKLNIVDLAGSERISRTDPLGNVFREARFINLSLHFLERVIVSLQEGAQYIPYRSSLLTSLLRDSLGGNSKTRMIATLNCTYVDESISTCRFAQRVAFVRNRPITNDAIDPHLHITLLQRRIHDLEEQLHHLQCVGPMNVVHEHAESNRHVLEIGDQQVLNQQINDLMRTESPFTRRELLETLPTYGQTRIRYCYELFVRMLEDARRGAIHRSLTQSNPTNVQSQRKYERLAKQFIQSVDLNKSLARTNAALQHAIHSDSIQTDCIKLSDSPNDCEANRPRLMSINRLRALFNESTD